LPVRKTAVSTLKRLNEFQSIPHESLEWKIYVGTGKNIFLPEGTHDIAGDSIFNHLLRQLALRLWPVFQTVPLPDTLVFTG
jgi:hypothetical protein